MLALRTSGHGGPFSAYSVCSLLRDLCPRGAPRDRAGASQDVLPSWRTIRLGLPGTEGLGRGGGYEQGKKVKDMLSLFRGMRGPMPSDPSHTHPFESTPDPDFKADKASRPWALLCEQSGILCRALGWGGICPDCRHGPAEPAWGDWVCAGNGSDGALHLPRTGVVSWRNLPTFCRPGIPVLLFTGNCAPRPATVGEHSGQSCWRTLREPEMQPKCNCGPEWKGGGCGGRAAPLPHSCLGGDIRTREGTPGVPMGDSGPGWGQVWIPTLSSRTWRCGPW